MYVLKRTQYKVIIIQNNVIVLFCVVLSDFYRLYRSSSFIAFKFIDVYNIFGVEHFPCGLSSAQFMVCRSNCQAIAFNNESIKRQWYFMKKYIHLCMYVENEHTNVYWHIQYTRLVLHIVNIPSNLVKTTIKGPTYFGRYSP